MTQKLSQKKASQKHQPIYKKESDMGNPPYIPTDEARIQISALKSYGITNEEIAKYLHISIDTLTKFYQRELDTARTIANSEVARKLYKKAVKDEDLTAIIFWLKTQGRWRTEDTKNIVDSNEDLNREIKELRASLDAKNKKDY